MLWTSWLLIDTYIPTKKAFSGEGKKGGGWGGGGGSQVNPNKTRHF